MTDSLSPQAFESTASKRSRQRATLSQYEAIASVARATASGVSPFERADIDPEVPVALDIIGNPDDPGDPKKVIPVSQLDQIIKVTCPKIPNSSIADQAYAFLIRRGDDPEYPEDIIAFSTVVDSADFVDTYEMDFDLSALGIADGQDVRYNLHVGQGSDISNSYVSNPYPIRFDRRKPGSVPDFSHVVLPDEYIDEGVTLAQLQSEGGFKVKLLAYFEHEPDDETFVVFTNLATSAVVEYPAGRIPEPAHYLDVVVPPDFFVNNNIDGRISVALRAQDVAGNSNVGLAHELDMLIGSSPTGFQQISVPLFDDDSAPQFIDLADARTPPEFIVPYYDTPIAGDLVRVFINGDFEVTLPVIVGAPGADVAIGTIPTDVIESIGAGTNGQFSFVIDYELKRGAFAIPSGLPKTITCDLRSSGWGSELLTGIVRGANSTVDNEIPPEDSTSPLTATIPHLAKDGSEAFLTNDRITLYKVNMDGSNPVVIGPPASATAGADLTYNVNANMLVDGTNYVRYDNFRAHAGGASNTEVSPVWPVTVTASTGLPGGGNPLTFDRWMFRDARQRIMDPSGSPVQPSMNLRRARGNTTDGTKYLGVIVRIHHYANMAQGDRIDVTVYGYYNRFGTGAPEFTEQLPTYIVTDVDATGHRDTIIPEDALLGKELPPFSEETPPATEESRYADIIIPYDPTIRNLRGEGLFGVGSLRVTFTVTNAYGSASSDASNPLFLDVDARTFS